MDRNKILSPTPRVFFFLHLFDLTSSKALCIAELITVKIILLVQNTFVIDLTFAFLQLFKFFFTVLAEQKCQ